MDFIWALERYINYNKEKDPVIGMKVRSALNCIRFLTLTSKDITNTSLLTLEEMRDVIGSLPPDGNLSKMPASLSLNCDKRSGRKVLQDSDMCMIRSLNDIYSAKICIRCLNIGHSGGHTIWNCTYYGTIPDLKKTYEKYGHTFLLDYDRADLSSIYNIYKSIGLVK